MEQKTWIVSKDSQLYPNLYTLLIGHPGVGKSKTITAVRGFLLELEEFHIAPTSVTMASMVDCLLASKRTIINLPDDPMEFNSMMFMPDEWGAFMDDYKTELISGLTTFYDVSVPYSQWRRTKEIKIVIRAPQLSILGGSTPSNLMKFMPEIAWDQGFTSRMMMIFSDERPIGGNMFKRRNLGLPPDMVHDIKMVHSLLGEFKPTEEYREAADEADIRGITPAPGHPRLTHYCTRRMAHLLKLSMIASADRGNDLSLTKADFNVALEWLLEAEIQMPGIFQAGAIAVDAKTMEEIHHLVSVTGDRGMSEGKIVRLASNMVPAHSVQRLIEIMEKAQMIKAISIDSKTGLRMFKALPKS